MCEFNKGRWICPIGAFGKLYTSLDGGRYCIVHAVYLQNAKIEKFSDMIHGMDKECNSTVANCFKKQIVDSWYGYDAEYLDLDLDFENGAETSVTLDNMLVGKGGLKLRLNTLRRIKMKNIRADSMLVEECVSVNEFQMQSIQVRESLQFGTGGLLPVVCGGSIFNRVSAKNFEANFLGGSPQILSSSILIDNCNFGTAKVSLGDSHVKCHVESGSFNNLSISHKRDNPHKKSDLTVNRPLKCKNLEISGNQFGKVFLNGVSESGQLRVSQTSHTCTLGVKECEFYNVIDQGDHRLELKSTRVTDRLMIYFSEIYMRTVEASQNSEVQRLELYSKGEESKVIELEKLEFEGGRVQHFQLRDVRLSGKLTFKNLWQLGRISVRDCVIQDQFCISDTHVDTANFSATEFKSIFDISGTEFGLAPRFSKSDIGTNLRMNGKTKFRDISAGSKEAYAALRLKMSQAKLLEYSGFFHRLELRSAARSNYIAYSWYWPYELFSRCGQGVARPLVWLVIFAVIFSFIFKSIYCGCLPLGNSIDWGVVNFSASNVFRPFAVWGPKGIQLGGEVDSLKELFWLRMLSSIQSLGSAALLSLSLFALRRRFKLPS